MNLRRYFISIAVIVCTVMSSFCSGFQNLKVVAVSGGEEHTLVLAENGQVFSCGEGGQGRLGNGTYYSQSVLQRVLDGQMGTTSDLLEDIDNVAAGWIHSLFLVENGQVLACGANDKGELGNGSLASSTTPVWVQAGEQNLSHPNYSLANIISISAGRSGEHSLAVDSSYYCYAWGKDNKGQCGVNTSGDNSRYTRPKKVFCGQMETEFGFLENIIAISAGEEHSMALAADGYVYTFGDNAEFHDASQRGKLGINNTTDLFVTVPQIVHGVNNDGNLPNICAISAGWDHCMALAGSGTYAGRVYTWGNNGDGWDDYDCGGGRLGDGTTDDRAVPVFVKAGEQNPSNPTGTYLENIIAIAAGESHSMAIDANSNVLCWGDNSYGQLGNGTTTYSTTPVYVKLADGHKLSRITKIAAGYWHNLAIDSDGVLWVWGSENYGKLGLGGSAGERTTYQPTPVPIQLIYPPVHNITKSRDYYAIQEAVNDADDNIPNTIIVDEGTYYENVDIPSTKRLTIQSNNPNDPYIVARTIVDARSLGYQAFEMLDNAGTTTLSGLTIIRASSNHSILASNSNAVISNCHIYGTSTMYGVSSTSGGDITVRNCRIENGSYGIYASAVTKLEVYNSIISGASVNGIHASAVTSLRVCNNTISGASSYGICLSSPPSDSSSQIYDNVIYDNNYGIWVNSSSGRNISIRNNTVVKNNTYGMWFNSPSSNPAVVSNCIVYNNNDGTQQRQIYPSNKSNVSYCCVQNCSETNGNINDNPDFVDLNADNFHLKFDSPCIDANNASWTPPEGETDIDGQDRVIDGDLNGNPYVDMGADEYWAGDFNHDGIVNFKDFAKLANIWNASWDPPNTNYDPYNLYVDSGTQYINYQDLDILAGFWLTASSSYEGGGDQMQGDGLGDSLELDSGEGEELLDEGEPLGVFKLTVNGIVDHNDTIVLEPNETVSIGIWGDGNTPYYYGFIGVETGASASMDITYAEMLYQGNMTSINMVDDTEVADLLDTNNPFVWVELIDLAMPPDGPLPLDGQLIDDITFTGTGTLMLFDGEGNFLDSVTFTSSEP